MVEERSFEEIKMLKKYCLLNGSRIQYLSILDTKDDKCMCQFFQMFVNLNGLGNVPDNYNNDNNISFW